MDKDTIDYKEEAKKQWGRDPAGSTYTSAVVGTKKFFDEVEFHRYREQPWTKTLIQNLQPAGKKVLEIGVGLGTDHLTFARLGAELTGLDITPSCIELTKKRFELEGEKSHLIVGDAERLPFNDNQFDMVYSFGVLHHTPHIEKAIDEIYRVLKPQGVAVITLYNLHSLCAGWIYCSWLIHGAFLKESFANRLRRIEASTENEGNPLIRLLTKKKCHDFFSNFSHISISQNHVASKRHIESFRKLFGTGAFSKKILDTLAKHFGWYLIVEAQK